MIRASGFGQACNGFLNYTKIGLRQRRCAKKTEVRSLKSEVRRLRKKSDF